MFCVDARQLVSNGDLRGATLWTGGPKGMASSNMMLIVNCRTRVSVLQDDTGVNIGASTWRDQPRHMSELLSGICALKASKPDRNLRQF